MMIIGIFITPHNEFAMYADDDGQQSLDLARFFYS